MKIDLKRWLFSDKKRIAITISMILIVVIALIGTSTVLNNSSSSEVNAMILVDNEMLRVGETFTYDGGNSMGDIKSYSWDFGDGNTSSNKTGTHSYDLAGWYDINLTVFGHDKQKSNATIVVGVQQIDNRVERNFDRNVWLFSGRFGTGATLEVGPNIGNPSLLLEFHLEGAVGNIGYTLWLDQDGRHSQLCEESFTATGGAFDFSKRFEAWDLPLEIQSTNTNIDVHIWIDEGKWSSGSLIYESTFPFENLSRT